MAQEKKQSFSVGSTQWLAAQNNELRKENDNLNDLNWQLQERINMLTKQIEELMTRKLKIGQVIQKRDGYNYVLPIIRIDETPVGVRLIVG